MSDLSDPQRESVHEAIQKAFDEAGILTGWVLITEWASNEGERALGTARSESTTQWEAKGMLHTALFDLPILASPHVTTPLTTAQLARRLATPMSLQGGDAYLALESLKLHAWFWACLAGVFTLFFTYILHLVIKDWKNPK
jgi:hypothetical protein